MTEEIKPKVRISKSMDERQRTEQEVIELRDELYQVMDKHIKAATKNTPSSIKKYLDSFNSLISTDISSSMISAKMAVTAHTLDLCLPELINTISTEAAKFNKQRLAESARDIFNKESKNIMIDLLGATDKWGRFEVDNCNNRNSAITEYIKRNAEPILQEIVGEEMENFKSSGIKKIKASVSKAIINGVDNHIQETLNYRIREKIKELAQPLIDEIIQKGIDKYESNKAFCNTGNPDE